MALVIFCVLLMLEILVRISLAPAMGGSDLCSELRLCGHDVRAHDDGMFLGAEG
jgi:hypothetical protein